MKTICLTALVVFASTIVIAQNEEALHIPLETDNQFPPDQLESGGLIEGSGEGIEETKFDTTTEYIPPAELENIDDDAEKDIETTPSLDSNSELPCPNPCVCSIEGDTNNYVVDCSGYELTEFPSPLDPRTTTLKLHNNKLTEIPKEISALKNLKILNAENNSIMELALGSVSELPELVTLKLANNRLIEYPKDLKNSISLTKLEELDLGGNDIRTVLTSEIFTNFKSLRKLTLPTATSELVLDLCGALKNTLESICTESCSTKIFECPDTPEKIDEDLLDATLPGTISLSNSIIEDNNDPVVETANKNDDVINTEEPPVLIETASLANDNLPSVSDFSLRAKVNNEPQEISPTNAIVNEPHDDTHEEVKLGANTIATKTGGVDKSIIGIIVAGMIVVVAGITIKKNWSSITKRFSSTPRPHERNGGVQSNGTTPEEVPLQDKSPV